MDGHGRSQRRRGPGQFGLAHFYAPADTAILLFSVFTVTASVSMIVAGAALIHVGVGQRDRRLVAVAVWVPRVATVPVSVVGGLPCFDIAGL